MAECSVASCGRPEKTRGWCHAHYMRWWYTGEVRPDDLLIDKSASLSDRFWKFVAKAAPDACWHWQGSVGRTGYGYVSVNGSAHVAHRISYELHHGGIPEGAQVDHVCHSRDDSCRGGWNCQHRRCVNPTHLEAVTAKVNAQRGRAADRIRERAAAITDCPQGHNYETVGWYVATSGSRVCKECAHNRALAKSFKGRGLRDPRRTSDEQVAQVRAMLAAGQSHSQIAAAVGISAATVSRIRTGGSWFAPT